MTPEAKARETIDRKLALAGWVVQDVSSSIWVLRLVWQFANIRRTPGLRTMCFS